MAPAADPLPPTPLPPSVRAVFGEPAPGIPVVPVADLDVARLFAEADERLHGPGAVVHAGNGVFLLPSGAAVDPDAPAVPDRWQEPPDDLVARVGGAVRPVVLAGPGVVRDGVLPDLRALAAGAHLGVLNTWGAKGIFDWRSRHHLATIGLQADDFVLGGLGDADLVVGIGLDTDESPAERWQLAPAVVVPTGMLGPLTERWRRSGGEIEVPPIRQRLGAATQAGWARTAVPISPAQVTRAYGQVVSAGGIVAADPGLAGFWVARTLGTTQPSAVHVPASPGNAGFAVACAAVARLRRPSRPALAVVDAGAELGPVREAIASLGIAVGIEVWDPEGERLDVDAHAARLTWLATAAQTTEVSLATDPRALDAFVEAAGPVVAWGGLRSR